MKSGKFTLGYKTVLKSLRSGKGERRGGSPGGPVDGREGGDLGFGAFGTREMGGGGNTLFSLFYS